MWSGECSLHSFIISMHVISKSSVLHSVLRYFFHRIRPLILGSTHNDNAQHVNFQIWQELLGRLEEVKSLGSRLQFTARLPLVCVPHISLFNIYLGRAKSRKHYDVHEMSKICPRQEHVSFATSCQINIYAHLFPAYISWKTPGHIMLWLPRVQGYEVHQGDVTCYWLLDHWTDGQNRH